MTKNGWFSKNGSKFLWAVIPAVLISFLTLTISRWIDNRSPKIVVRQFYNEVEARKAVPDQIGGLTLDYETPTQVSQSYYVVQISNEGRGPDSDVRLSIKFPDNLAPHYHEEPDLKIYRVEDLVLDNGSFFMSLKIFPQNALAPVSFDVGNKEVLCKVKIKAAGSQKEATIDSINGVNCENL